MTTKSLKLVLLSLLPFVSQLAQGQSWVAPPAPITDYAVMRREVPVHHTSLRKTGNASDTIRVPQDYPTIQEAIYHAGFGTVVYVSPGRYQEHIVLARGVTLQGANHNDSTVAIYDFNGPIIQAADSARVSGFIIVNRTSYLKPAPTIYASNANRFVVSNNILLGAQYWAMIQNDNSSLIIENNYFWDPFREGHGYNTNTYRSANVIRNNWFSGSGVAIQVRGQDTVEDNTIANCVTGIITYGSPEIRGNEIANCKWSLFMYGNGTVYQNTILFGPYSTQMGVGVEPGSTAEIHDNTLAGGSVPFAIGFRGSFPTFKRNRISGTFSTGAVYCLQGAAPNIVNNTILGGKHVIYLEGGSSPTIKNNILTKGNEFGIYALGGGFSPVITYNNISENGIGATFNVPVGTGNITENPRLLSPLRFSFADGTSKLLSASRVMVYDPSRYMIGLRIELGDDDVLRKVTKIAGDTLDFEPPFAFNPEPLSVLRNGDPLAVLKCWSTDTIVVESFRLMANSPCINAGDPSQIDPDGSRIDIGAFPFSPITTIQDIKTAVPTFILSQNFPNPFNPATTIEFSILRSGKTTLKVFNLLGEEIETLVGGELSAGRHSVRWNAVGRASGIYFYRLQAGEFTETKKLLLLR